MYRDLRHSSPFLTVAILLFFTTTSFALIQYNLPLEALATDSDFIFVAKVEKIDAQAPLVVLAVQEDIRGKVPSRRLAVNFKGDEEAKKLGHVPQLLKRLAPDLRVVVTVTKREKVYQTFVYTNGTWFQMLGQETGNDSGIAWTLMHGEPFLRRTFKGTTAEMRQLMIDGVAGKGKLPAFNKKEPPGFGPEIPAKEKTGWRALPSNLLGQSGGPLFGVIPTIGVGAPLMVLAALFPAVFGGVLLLFRQWIAFITVFSLNSTLLLLNWLLNSYWPGVLRDSWVGTDAGLWFFMTLVALAGTIWAWQRQLARQARPDPSIDAPRATELRVLWILAAVFVLVSVMTPLVTWMSAKHYDPLTDLPSVAMGVLTLGVVVGAVYRTAREYSHAAAPLATEGVMVAAILLGQVGYTAYRWSGEELGITTDPRASITGAAAVGGVGLPHFERIRWQFAPERFTGVILAAPLVHGDDVWVAAARTTYRQGTLFCLDRADGTKKGEFIGKESNLKQMISSPVIVDDRLYMGEGFHDDPRCRLFCVDVRDRKELWAFQTESQTEPGPCVTGGKVFFGAGNDGIYCADAATGTQLWRYPPKEYSGRLLRCGSSPAVLGDRLFAGSAVDRNQAQDRGETAIFCLDAISGREQWKKAVPLPVWAGPVVRDGQVIYALGNGDVLDDAENEKPAGLVLSVDPATGLEQWRCEVPNGVLDKPAVDEQQVYFGCRDGHVYCLGRHDGKLRWKKYLDAPVVAAPVIARCPGYSQTAHVFVVSSAGKVACLEPNGGHSVWVLPLTNKKAYFTATPRVAVARTDTGDRRQIIVAGAIGEVGVGRPIVFCLEDFVKAE
jgi:PQQ-like domain